jgi:hypothetical protein
MKLEDVKVGMKVVPHSKSVVNTLNDSCVWRNALKNKDHYLTVKCFNGIENCWVLYNSDIGFGGDYFLAEDFEPYTE